MLFLQLFKFCFENCVISCEKVHISFVNGSNPSHIFMQIDYIFKYLKMDWSVANKIKWHKKNAKKNQKM